MGSVSALDRYREGRTAERGRVRPATLKVAIETGPPDNTLGGVMAINLRVTGAKLPIRLYLYIDGELADAWVEAEATYEVGADDLGLGRHTVTARAVDA